MKKHVLSVLMAVALISTLTMQGGCRVNINYNVCSYRQPRVVKVVKTYHVRPVRVRRCYPVVQTWAPVCYPVRPRMHVGFGFSF